MAYDVGYRRATALNAKGSAAVLINAGTAGTVVLTLADKDSDAVTVTVPVGSTILPFNVIKAVPGTATGATAQALYFE